MYRPTFVGGANYNDHRWRTTITAAIAVLFLCAPLGLALGRFAALLAPLALAAVLLAVPADEARADAGHPGEHPLHCAAGINGYLAAVAHLLGSAHGIDVNARDDVTARDPSGSYYSCGSVRIYNDRRNTPLYWAARYGRAAIAATLIAAGAEVNAKDNIGYTPLHSAAGGRASVGRTSVVSLLLAAGAEVNAKNNDGETPLHNAAFYGRADIAAMLIAAGAEVNAKDNDGETPLRWTRKGGQSNYPASFRALLIAAGGHWGEACAGAAVVNPAYNPYSYSTPCLCESPNVGNGDNCQVPSAQVCGQRARFHDATAGECVPFKPCAGGTLDRETNTCECAAPAVLDGAGNNCRCPAPNLEFAVGDYCRARSAESCGSLNPPLLYDSNAGECGDRFYPCHDSAIRKADNSGCECPEGAYAHGDPSGGMWNSSGSYKSIPSTAICHADHAPVVHGLGDWTAAITMNSHEIVSHFIADHGRDPGGNDLNLAAEHDAHLAALVLIEGGADVNFRPRIVAWFGVYTGSTPLRDAVRNSSFRTAKLLLQRGANPDETSYVGGGDTHLHEAARLPDTLDNVALVSLLLDKGADPNIRNDDGWRPLDLAYDGGEARTWQARRKMMAALIAWGARWSDECPGGAIPNENYYPDFAMAATARCVCPLHISEFTRGKCECPAHSHAQVNGRCLAKNSEQALQLEIEKMRLELERLRLELAALNLRLSLAADGPPEMLEEVAKQAEVAARGIARRRDNFLALARAGLAEAGDAGAAPMLALSDTEATCRMLDGEVQTHSRTGAKICSGIDFNDTFCIVGSASAFPCMGFFRHVRQCNDDHNRPALDPWHCAAPCPSGLRARGAKCAAD